MPCSFCGTVGHNRRTCQRFDLLVAAATEEQPIIDNEDTLPHEPLDIRNLNGNIINTARTNLLNVIDNLFQYNEQLNPAFITPNRSRSPSPPLSPERRPLTMQPIGLGYGSRSATILLPPHSPQAPLTMQPIASGNATATMLLERNMPHGLTRIPSFDNIANLFNDASEDGFDDDDLPDLIPIETKNLVDCVDKPCSTDSCAICLDKLSNVDLFVTRCGHQYHGTCMIQHIKKKDNCPLCRGLLHV